MTSVLPPLDSMHSLYRCVHTPFLVDKASLAELQCFPFEQANPVSICASEVEPIGQAFSRVVRCGDAPRLTLLDLAPQHFPEQRFLIAKIVIQHALIYRGAPRNIIYARAGKSFGGKLLERRLKNSLPRSLRIARSPLRS